MMRSREEGYVMAGLWLILAATACWWALALWPTSADAPEWLARTRYVCFGVRGSGPPDAAGWITLLLQPLGMLVVLMIGWTDGVRSLYDRARAGGTPRALATIALLLTLTGIGAAGWRVRTLYAAQTFPAGSTARSVIALGTPAPPLELIDQTGAVRSLERLQGSTVLLTFAFAHCETVCPLLVQDVLEAQRTLHAAGTHEVAVLVVTLDPWRDTPQRLPHIARAWHFGRNAWVLGGDVATVERTLDAWQIPRSRSDRTGDIIHPAIVYVITPDGTLAYQAAGDAGTLAELVRNL